MMGYSLKKAFLKFSKTHNLILPGQKIIVAVSGGIDSMVILSLLLSWRRYFNLTLAVIHINHQLRGKESNLDEQFVSDICKELKIQIYIKNTDVSGFAKQNKYSLEEAGHILRKQIFKEIIEQENFDSVATAHNINDQVETLLMRIIEGTGITGLGGIRLKKDGIIRPLLFASRRQIEEYAKANNIKYREDKSNKELRFKRNRIRHKLVPFLSKEFSNYKEQHFLNLSLIVQDLEKHSISFLNSVLEKLEFNKSENKIALEIEMYQKYFSGIQIKILEHILLLFLKREVIISFNKFSDFQYWFNFNKEGKKFILHPEVFISKKKDRLVFQKATIPSGEFFTELNKESEIYLSDSGIRITFKKVSLNEVVFTDDNSVEFIDGIKANFPLTLRTWREGDLFKPLGLKRHRLVSDFLTDLKVEYPLRKAIVVLEKENEITAVPGFRISEDYKITDKTTEALKISVIKL